MSGYPAMSLAEAHALLTRPGAPFEMEEAEIGGRRTRVWSRAHANLRDVFVAGEAYGDRIFLVHGEERVSFDAFGRAARMLASLLMDAGVKPGDRVAIGLRNLPEWPVAFFAAVCVGAVVAPLNAWWTGEELENAIGLVDPTVLILDQERLDRLGRRDWSRRMFIARPGRGALPASAASLDALIGPVRRWPELPRRDLPAVPIAPDHDATIFFTSGTTGRSKGALGTHRAMTSNIAARGITGARRFLRAGEPIPSPAGRPQRCGLLAIPFFHMTGCSASLVPALAAGERIVLMHRFEPEAAMALVERERVNAIGGVPSIVWQMIEHPRRGEHDLSSVDAIGYGGSAAGAALIERIRAVFPSAMPSTGWGMTETTASFTTVLGEDYLIRPATCGLPLPVNDVRIVGSNGRDLAAGEAGELLVRGPTVVRGYYGDEAATRAAFSDGWLRTGDLARLDGEGFCYIEGRIKDIVIRGGENISCPEVEEAIFASAEGVVDAALVGLPHQMLGEVPGAVVRVREGVKLGPEEVRQRLAARLAAYKVPERVVVTTEALARNPGGKLMKREIRARFFPG